MTSRSKVQDNSYVSLAIRYKRQLDDIISIAYEGHPLIVQFKNYRVTFSTRKYSSRLGDCCYQKDGSSLIRIHNCKQYSWDTILITLIHEVAHHVDKSIRGSSGHDRTFYYVHLRLLMAAFDMGIIPEARIYDLSKAEERGDAKLAGLLKKYKEEARSEEGKKIIVYVKGCFYLKDKLKERGYQWDGRVKCWFKELDDNNYAAEQDHLAYLGVEKGIFKLSSYYHTKAVEYKKGLCTVCVKGAFDVKDIIKQRGYTWNAIGKHWERECTEFDLPGEFSYLKRLGLEETVSYIKQAAVMSRTNHAVKLYRVGKEYAVIPKKLGYRWDPEFMIWEKEIQDEELAADEKQVLNDIPGIRIKII